MIHCLKNYLLHKDATCLFSECCFLELLARPSSIRTLLSSGFVVLFSIFRLCSSQSGFCRAPFQFERFILVLFPWPSSVYLLLVFLFCPAFHKAPSILNASFGVFFPYFFLYPALLVVLFWLAFPSVSLLLVCFLGVVHMSQPVAG